MMDQLCLDMAAKGMVTDCVSLYIVYSGHQGIPGTGDSAKFTRMTNLSTDIVPAIDTLYRLIVDPKLPIRRVNISCGVSPDTGAMQLNMFEDTTKQLKGKALQEAILSIRSRYGKNSILKGMNYEEAATWRERNLQIGGHRSGTG